MEPGQKVEGREREKAIQGRKERARGRMPGGSDSTTVIEEGKAEERGTQMGR